ncbi:hypothetical protein J2Y49_005687 [Azospirillum sp. BE72]|nr:hypothetical protein [Azospirillum sp. BE72]
MQILDHRIEIKGLKLLGIVEVPAHWVGQWRIAVKHFEIEGIRPPVAIPAAATATPGEWTFACAFVGPRVHRFLLQRLWVHISAFTGRQVCFKAKLYV